MKGPWLKEHCGRRSHQSARCFTSVRLIFLSMSIVSSVLHLKTNPNQTFIFKDACLIFESKWDGNLTMKKDTQTKKKPRETKPHVLVNPTQHQQIAVFATYRPSCCCGSPCHACPWCPWMKRGRGPFRLSHSLWAQCLRGTRRPHLKEGRKQVEIHIWSVYNRYIFSEKTTPHVWNGFI